MELVNQIDQTLSFNEKTIRVIGTTVEPWFVAKDICEILDLPNITHALRSIPERWRGLLKVNTFGGEQEMITVNEAALYKLIMRSRKPVAQKFQEFVCEEILPSIRKTGEYKFKAELEKQSKRIEELEKEKEEEKSKLEAILASSARERYEKTYSVYIISNPEIKNCYKIGKTENRNIRLKCFVTGSPVSYIIEHSRELSTADEQTMVEKYMLTLFDTYREISETEKNIRREWVRNVSLENLKNALDAIVDQFLELKAQFSGKPRFTTNLLPSRDSIRGVNYNTLTDSYRARLTLGDKEFSKNFSVKKFGKETALKMAIDWRRHLCTLHKCTQELINLDQDIEHLQKFNSVELLPDVLEKRKRTQDDCGIVGVNYVLKANSYVVRLKYEGKPYSKSFSLKKYGDNALSLAIAYRKKLCEDFNCDANGKKIVKNSI